MTMNYVRRGMGKPLLLIHGIGSSHKTWNLIIDELAAHREVIAVDLPGFGKTPPMMEEVSISTLADAVTDFLEENNLIGIDAVGSSMGARLVLELARRGGVLGAVISLDPGGFWEGWETHFFYYSVRFSAQFLEQAQPFLPMLTNNPLTKTALLAQLSARPWKVPNQVALNELRSFRPTPTFVELLDNLAYGEKQQGAPAHSISSPLVIGWGRQDYVCFPNQAKRALNLFPDAQLHWFSNSGHFPQIDVPQETTQLILEVTDGVYQPQEEIAVQVVKPVALQSKPAFRALVGAGTAVIALGIFLALRAMK